MFETQLDSNVTGIVTVTTAGTEVTGGDIFNQTGFLLKAHPDNTDTVWFMGTGQAKTAGFPLDLGECAFCNVTNLSMLDFDADVSGEKVCWSKMP